MPGKTAYYGLSAWVSAILFVAVNQWLGNNFSLCLSKANIQLNEYLSKQLVETVKKKVPLY